MSTTQDFNRLGEEIAQAYEERALFSQKFKQDTADLLDIFAKTRSEMSQAVRTELNQFKTELDTAEIDRKKDALVEVNQRRSDVQGLLKDLDSSHQAMATQLRAELAQFITDLSGQSRVESNDRVTEVENRKVGVQSFLNDFSNEQKAMGKALRSELKTCGEDRKARVHEFLALVKAENFDRAAAWKNVLATIRSGFERNGKNLPAEEQSPTEKKSAMGEEEDDSQPLESKDAEQTEAVYAESPEAEDAQPPDRVESSGNVDYLKRKIAETLKNYSDGLKMIQVAEMLNVEQWRLLIPIMRDLQDIGAIRKEGSLYFSE